MRSYTYKPLCSILSITAQFGEFCYAFVSHTTTSLCYYTMSSMAPPSGLEPLPKTSEDFVLPLHYGGIWQGRRELNPHDRLQGPLCCLYITPHYSLTSRTHTRGKQAVPHLPNQYECRTLPRNSAQSFPNYSFYSLLSSSYIYIIS